MQEKTTTTISDRQLELISAAGKILSRSGVGGLTTKNLAAEMQFSESAIYRHFAGKEEIIIALLEYLAAKLDEQFANALKKEQSPEEKFTSLFQAQFAFFKKNPHFVVAVFSDGLMEESARINETILKIMSVKTKHLLPVIREGQQKKVFTDAIAADALLHIVMGGFRLLMFKWRVAGFETDIVRNGNAMINSVLTIIKTK